MLNLALGRTIVAAILFFSVAIPTHATAENTKITGKVRGFGSLAQDDWIDGAIVFPSFNASTLFQFDLDSLLSPSEPMTIGPKTIQVPGNAYFPRQTETYIFSLQIAKEQFTLLLPKGEKAELAAISIRAPFSQLADLAMNHAPLTQMLSLIQVNSAAFIAAQDWSQEKSPVMDLKKPLKNFDYEWKRTAGPKGSLDVAMNLQKTAVGKWVLTDLQTKTAAQGKFSAIEGLQDEARAMFVRIRNDANGSPQSVTGLIRSGASHTPMIAGEIPQALTGQLERTTRTVTWNAIGTPGWMAVLKVKQPKKQKNEIDSPESLFQRIFTLGFGDITPSAHGQSKAQVSWIQGSVGRHQLSELAQDETVVLLFVGTEQEVHSPAEDAAQEPELFQKAIELRLQKL